jgi:hypothetical protein
MTENDRQTIEARILADIMECPPDERPHAIRYYLLAMFADRPEDSTEQDIKEALVWFLERIINALPEEDRRRFLAISDSEESRERIGEIARVEWLNGNPALLEHMIVNGDQLSVKTRAFVAGIIAGRQKRPHGNRKPARPSDLAAFEDLKIAQLAREALDAEKWLMRHSAQLEGRMETDVDRAAKERIADEWGISRSTFEKLLSPEILRAGYANVSPSKNGK